MAKEFEKARAVSEVECHRGYACIRVDILEGWREVSRILGALAEEGISFSIPKIHENVLTFAFPEADGERAMNKLKSMGYDPRLIKGCALVTVYAPDMRDLFGIMVQILEAMLNKRTEVLQVGDSYNSVSCLINEGRLRDAVEGLGEVFSQCRIKCE